MYDALVPEWTQEDWNGLKFSTISAHKKRGGVPTPFLYLT